ncbi:MAG: hypothetical protein GC152_15540 [Alphaproteobacteria bacterium]|nr:hypothetical protein [Alphaproteobacteria bacterium]
MLERDKNNPGAERRFADRRDDKGAGGVAGELRRLIGKGQKAADGGGAVEIRRGGKIKRCKDVLERREAAETGEDDLLHLDSGGEFHLAGRPAKIGKPRKLAAIGVRTIVRDLILDGGPGGQPVPDGASSDARRRLRERRRQNCRDAHKNLRARRC